MREHAARILHWACVADILYSFEINCKIHISAAHLGARLSAPPHFAASGLRLWRPAGRTEGRDGRLRPPRRPVPGGAARRPSRKKACRERAPVHPNLVRCGGISPRPAASPDGVACVRPFAGREALRHACSCRTRITLCSVCKKRKGQPRKAVLFVFPHAVPKGGPWRRLPVPGNRSENVQRRSSPHGRAGGTDRSPSRRLRSAAGLPPGFPRSVRGRAGRSRRR